MAHVLRVDGSARTDGSVSRQLTDEVVARLRPAELTVRDLLGGVPLIDETWVGANFTPAAERSAEQRAALAPSDELVAELKAADVVVLGVPIYNFSVPAAVKAWIDQVARAGVTFQYTENGPKGLLTNKRAIVVITSGGTKSGSEIDFATDYMRHVLGFLGIEDVEVVAADQLMVDQAASMARAEAVVGTLAA
ncbi:MAG: NAD(P)H-dependent oxidoreductase [Pseudomonadota bacterium]